MVCAPARPVVWELPISRVDCSESREMTKQKARMELNGLASELALQPYHVECAVRVYERCLDMRCVQGPL